MFNNKHYPQMSGISMVNKTAQSTANSFMGEFESKHVYSYKDPAAPFWGGFIDNILMIHTLDGRQTTSIHRTPIQLPLNN